MVVIYQTLIVFDLVELACLIPKVFYLCFNPAIIFHTMETRKAWYELSRLATIQSSKAQQNLAQKGAFLLSTR